MNDECRTNGFVHAFARILCGVALLLSSISASPAPRTDPSVIRAGLDKINAADAATLAEKKFQFGDQNLRELPDLSRKIMAEQQWDFVPDLIKIVDRHRAGFGEPDEPIRLGYFTDAINAIGASKKHAAYLVGLAESCELPLWRDCVFGALARSVGKEDLNESDAAKLKRLLFDFSTGPEGTSPSVNSYLLKKRLGLLSPPEAMLDAQPEYGREQRTDLGEFSAIKSIEYADKTHGDQPQCEIITRCEQGAGAHGWETIDRIWIFQSPAKDGRFQPGKATLIYHGLLSDFIGHRDYDQSMTVRLEFSASPSAPSSRIPEYARMATTYQQCDQLRAVETTSCKPDLGDGNFGPERITTVSHFYTLQDGKFVPSPDQDGKPAAKQKE